ncbi:DUF3304 domain-containing protein [Herbaspirillum robiniae]|uniref:DUF3304 domain-containing protein n=1 Tax=Herbaspirillum robiniae TaxID=2014887 RepID=UPI003D778288
MSALPTKILVTLLAATLLSPLVGCHDAQSLEEGYAMDFTAYNHTDHSIDDFEFKLTDGKRAAGGFVGKGEGGGDICCTSVPKQWKPFLIARVHATWQDGSGATQQISTEVPVPQYSRKDTGHMNIHFLRNGEVKVLVTSLETWHPDYPLQGKDVELKSILR